MEIRFCLLLQYIYANSCTKVLKLETLNNMTHDRE